MIRIENLGRNIVPMIKWNIGRSVLLFAILCLYLSACVTTKNTTYFKDIPDTVRNRMVVQATYKTPTIQPDDILQVSIQTLDAGSTALLNQQSTATWPLTGAGSISANATGAPGVSGYLVDKSGFVVLPLIGKINVKDKTTEEVREDLIKKVAEYYKDPVVNVRFANFKITVLGEVTRPATYVMPNEKVTLLDALGVAGDLTIYGKRENILLIRENDGKKEFVRFNLNESKLFSSPYFFLHQGDVVYVEPNKARVVATDAARLRSITIVTSLITLTAVIIARIKF